MAQSFAICRFFASQDAKNFFIKKSVDGNFVDSLRIRVKAGNGGNGGVGFYRSSKNPKGRPCGGNGGQGGSVYFVADSSLSTLNSIPSILRAQNGANGGPSEMHGKMGEDLRIRVPVGTSIIPCILDETNTQKLQINTNELAIEMDTNEKQILAILGGRGGKGNKSLGKNNHDFDEGKAGAERHFLLDMKTIADVGLVGMPNAGKSSFLGAVSNAHPKVAPYPFTTLNPFVGTVQFPDYTEITVADIPGLIKGAHLNLGLGHSFLKHILKTPIIGYVLDVSLEEPWKDLDELMYELKMYNGSLVQKDFFIIANKIDKGSETEQNVMVLQTMYPGVKVFPISAKYSSGIIQVTSYLKEEKKKQRASK